MRWRDLDGLGHVNHAVAFSYMEEGRDVFLRDHGIPREQYVVGCCTVNFKNEIDPSWELVTVESKLRGIRRSAMTIEQWILDPVGDVMVEAEFGIVLWDPTKRASRLIDEQERASLTASLEGETQP